MSRLRARVKVISHHQTNTYIYYEFVWFVVCSYSESVYCFKKILQNPRNWRAKRKTEEKKAQYVFTVFRLMWVHFILSMHHESVDSMLWLVVCHVPFFSLLILASTTFYSNKWRMQYLCFFFRICRLQWFLRLHFDLEPESQFNSHPCYPWYTRKKHLHKYIANTIGARQ